MTLGMSADSFSTLLHFVALATKADGCLLPCDTRYGSIQHSLPLASHVLERISESVEARIRARVPDHMALVFV